jgi:hypothetical protein
MTPASGYVGTDRLAFVPAYPALFSAAIVLGSYGATHVSLEELWRPLGVAVALAASAVALGGLLTDRWHPAAAVTAIAVLSLFGLWPFVAATVAAAIAAGTFDIVRRRGNRGMRVMASGMNVLGVAWVLIALTSAVLATLAAPPLPPAKPVDGLGGESRNIYVILLDGYPRADTLQRYFAYDNEPFIASLEARGFHVSHESRSDYNLTLQTVPSMLHMTPAENLGLVPFTASQDQHRRVEALINASPVVASFREIGYEIVSIVPAAAALNMRDAEVVWEESLLSPFEDSLLDEGLLNLVSTELRYEDRRRSVNAAFDALAQVARERKGPRFVYAHIMAPHAPFAFTRDGGPAMPVPCEPQCDVGTTFLQPGFLDMTLQALEERFIGNLEYVNRRVLEAAEEIRTFDPQAVVVFFSDHGSRLDLADPDEWFRNFFAAHTPDHPALFGDAPTPTNIFRELFTAYLGADLPAVPLEPLE